MAGHNANDQPGHQKIVIEHPSRHVVESGSEERHRNYNPANESATQRCEAGSSTADPVDNSLPLPVRKLSSCSTSTSSSWDIVQVSEALPSLTEAALPSLPTSALPSLTTSAPSVATAVQNHEAPETEEKYDELTTSKLQAFNENVEPEVGVKRSVKAKKGTATSASDDSVELMGQWAPGDGDREPDISAVGAWTDEIPRSALELADEIDSL